MQAYFVVGISLLKFRGSNTLFKTAKVPVRAQYKRRLNDPIAVMYRKGLTP